MGDGIKPAAERPIHTHRSGLADENEKRGLEGILRLVTIAEHTAADPPDHCPMAIQKRREGHFRRCRCVGRFSPPGVVLVEELAIGKPRRRPDLEQGSQLPQWAAGPSASHDCASRREVRSTHTTMQQVELSDLTF